MKNDLSVRASLYMIALIILFFLCGIGNLDHEFDTKFAQGATYEKMKELLWTTRFCTGLLFIAIIVVVNSVNKICYKIDELNQAQAQRAKILLEADHQQHTPTEHVAITPPAKTGLPPVKLFYQPPAE